MYNTTPIPTATLFALSRSSLQAVRRAVHAYREGWVDQRRLGVAARIIAEDAHRHGLAAERMLVALKQEWAGLQDVWTLPPLDARELLSVLVTLSVRAYYEPAGVPRHGGGRPTLAGHSDARRDARGDARTAA